MTISTIGTFIIQVLGRFIASDAYVLFLAVLAMFLLIFIFRFILSLARW